MASRSLPGWRAICGTPSTTWPTRTSATSTTTGWRCWPRPRTASGRFAGGWPWSRGWRRSSPRSWRAAPDRRRRGCCGRSPSFRCAAATSTIPKADITEAGAAGLQPHRQRHRADRVLRRERRAVRARALPAAGFTGRRDAQAGCRGRAAGARRTVRRSQPHRGADGARKPKRWPRRWKRCRRRPRCCDSETAATAAAGRDGTRRARDPKAGRSVFPRLRGADPHKRGRDGYACVHCHATHTLFNATYSTALNVVDQAESREQPDSAQADVEFGDGGRRRVRDPGPWRRRSLHQGLAGIRHDSGMDQGREGVSAPLRADFSVGSESIGSRLTRPRPCR